MWLSLAKVFERCRNALAPTRGVYYDIAADMKIELLSQTHVTKDEGLHF